MQIFNVLAATLTAAPTTPAPYAHDAHRFGPQIGARKLGGTVYELPSGHSLFPYHYESEEEWLIVLAGEVTVRHPEGRDVLGPGDVTAFPSGPAGAHKTTNDGGETARFIMLSTVDAIGYAVYPDSNKVSYWSDSGVAEDDVRVYRGQRVAYFEGEV